MMLAGCGEADRPAEPPPLPVEVVRAEATPETVVSGVGRVEREREMLLSFRVPGIVSRLSVDIGDSFGAGQALSELDGRDFAARLRQTTGEVERAQRAAARYEGLSAEGAVPRSRFEDERTLLDQARAAQSAAAYDRQSTRLAAPSAGIVLERLVQRGETVAAGQGVLRIADIRSTLLIRVAIAGDRLAEIRPGASARIAAHGSGTMSTGTVMRIGRRVDSRTGTAQVEIRLPESARLTSGMTANVDIAVPGPPTGPRFDRVPAEAIVEAKGDRAILFLFDRRSGRARRLDVRFGGFSGEEALVGGLPPGAVLITAGAGFVADGAHVRVAGATR